MLACTQSPAHPTSAILCCCAGYSAQSLVYQQALLPAHLAGQAVPATYIFPDTDAGNLGLCKFIKSLSVMPKEPVTPQQIIGQNSAIYGYTDDVDSTVYYGLKNITAPVLILAGSQDMVLSVQDDYILANEIPDASFFQFADAGHAAILQHAVTASQVVTAFLDA